MAAEVSSLARYLNGHRTAANASPVPEKQSVPITRDLLGGGPSKIEAEEIDLDLHVPTGWEKRLDLKLSIELKENVQRKIPPEPELKHDASDDEEKLDEPMELTPVRPSERNARKTYRYREVSSEDDPNPSDVASDEKETENGSFPDETDEGELKTVVQSNDQPTSSVTKSKETSQSKKGSLVQTTISTLFKKAAEEKVQMKLKKSPDKKGSGKKRGNTGSKRKIDQVEDDDDEDAIEAFTISSEDTDGSDDEWAA